MARRLGMAMEEISSIGRYDYRVINDDLKSAIGKVRAIITAEQCRLDAAEAEMIVNRYKEEL